MKTAIKNLLSAIIIGMPVLICSCKKSDSTPQPDKPTITTNAITNITATTATSGGNIGDSSTYYRIIGRGIMYSSVGDPMSPSIAPSQTYDFLATPNKWGSYPSSMTGLSANTTYYVRAYVGWEPLSTPGSNIIFGDLKTFKTAP